MNSSLVGRWTLVWLAVTGICGSIQAQETNSWSSSTSGNWEDASSWSLGVLPGTGQTILLTNHSWKAVAIGPATASNFPQTMTVDALNVASPGTDTVNTVLFNYAGFQTPFVTQSLNVSNDAQVVVLGSALNVQYGNLIVDGGAVTADAGAQVTAGSLQIQNGGLFDLASGTLALTNHGQESIIGGQFHQEGGSNLCDAFLDQGEYDLSNGDLMVRGGLTYVSISINGNFTQSGGTVVGDMGVGQTGTAGGYYKMSGGTIRSPVLYLPAPSYGITSDESYFLQTGGTNYATNMDVGSIFVQYGEYPWFGLGYYTLTNGLLVTSSLAINGRGGFAQSGGVHTNGTLTTTETEFLHQEQPGGNSYVYDQLGYYVLSGGTLVSGLVDMEPGNFTQTDGSARITTLQMVGGLCSLSGGQLSVSNIILSGGANFAQTGGTVTQTGALVLVDAGFTTGPGPQQFGGLQLGTAGSTNSTFTLSPGACALHFANSSSLNWSNTAMLIITNWNGSLSGGGSQQIFFGNDQTGLTSQQLGQVQFSNPAGLPSGMYSAQILSNGEVVPYQQPFISGPINSWINPTSGNWDDALSWSLGVLPGSLQSVIITNSVWKAVSVNSSTPVNSPGSMTVSNLTVVGPTNTENTLLLDFVGSSALKVLNSCAIQTNGTMLNLSSSFEVDGTLTLDDGTFTEVGGSTMANVPVNVINGGVLNSTNAALTLGAVTLGTALPTSGNLNQDGGSILAQSLVIQDGQFTLTSGTFYGIGGIDIEGFGGYLQWGGTNYGDVIANGINSGTFTVDGGLVHGNVLTIGGSIFQGGGVIEMQTIDWTGHNGNVLDGGILRSGVINVHSNALVFMGEGGTPSNVEADSMSISNTASVPVLAYNLFITNNLVLGGDSINTPASMDIEGTTGPGSILNAGTITLWSNSSLSLGFNTVSEISTGVDILGGSFGLAGGTLDSPYIGVGQNGSFTQSQGQNSVHGVLSITGTYFGFGGNLVTDGLYLRGSLLLETNFSLGIVFTNTGSVDLGGFLGVGITNDWLGQVQLSTNATIGFISTPAQLNFAASSGMSWAPSATMVISNWNNSGNTRIFFGTDASALSASQLAQIRFSNPGGFAPGVYSAKILNTGEVVPDHVVTTSVTFSQQGNNLVLTWPSGWTLQTATNIPGPYTDVPSATQPYTNDMTRDPQRFFRLRQ